MAAVNSAAFSLQRAAEGSGEHSFFLSIGEGYGNIQSGRSVPRACSEKRDGSTAVLSKGELNRMKMGRFALICLCVFCAALMFFSPEAKAEAITVTSAEELTETVSKARKDLTILLDLEKQDEEIVLENKTGARITLDGQGSEQADISLRQGTFLLENITVGKLWLYSSKKPLHTTVGEGTTIRAVWTMTPEASEFKANSKGTITLVNRGRIVGYGIRVMAGTASVTIENEGEITGGMGVFASDFWVSANGVPQKSGRRRIVNNGTITGILGPGIAWFGSKGTDLELSGSGRVRGISGIALYGSTAAGRMVIDHSIETICGELNGNPSLGREVYDYYELDPEGKTAEELADSHLKVTMGDALSYFMFISSYPGYPFILHDRALSYAEKNKTATDITVSGMLRGEKGCMVLPDAAHVTGKIRINAQITSDTPRTYVWSYCPDGKILGEEDAAAVLQASLKKYPFCADGEDYYIGIPRYNEQGAYIYLAGNNDLLPAETICHIRPDGTASFEDASYFNNLKNRRSGFEQLIGDFGCRTCTVILDEDLPSGGKLTLRPGYKNVTADGGGHLCIGGGVSIAQDQAGDIFTLQNFGIISSLSLYTKKNSGIALQDIGQVTGDLTASGEGKIEFRNVAFVPRESASNRKNEIKVESNCAVSFDESCRIDPSCLLTVYCYNTKREIRLDCPYGDAKISLGGKAGVSLTGSGRSDGTMELRLNNNSAKSEIETSVDTLEIQAYRFGGQLKLSGSQKHIKISGSQTKGN